MFVIKCVLAWMSNLLMLCYATVMNNITFDQFYRWINLWRQSLKLLHWNKHGITKTDPDNFFKCLWQWHSHKELMMIITIEDLITTRLGTLSFPVHFVTNLAMIPWDICLKMDVFFSKYTSSHETALSHLSKASCDIWLPDEQPYFDNNGKWRGHLYSDKTARFSTRTTEELKIGKRML